MKLTAHYSRAAACRLHLDAAVEHQLHGLERHDDVTVCDFGDWRDALRWLQPIRTFPKRFLVWQQAEWSFVVSDCVLEPCKTDVLHMSDLSGSPAGAGSWLPEDRRLSEMAQGRVAREVLCIKEQGVWEWQERGEPRPYESRKALARHRRADRLTPHLVRQYLSEVIGLPFDGPRIPVGQRIVGFERAWRWVRVQPREVDTEDDVTRHAPNLASHPRPVWAITNRRG